jgi:hypothetical protein
MNKYFNQTNGKILLVGIMIIGMIFLGSNKKESKDFDANTNTNKDLINNENKDKSELKKITNTEKEKEKESKRLYFILIYKIFIYEKLFIV